jgi:hypothetical protein
VDVGHAEVRVEEQHAPPELRAGDREVHRESRLAHAAFAAGHRDGTGALDGLVQVRANHGNRILEFKNPLMNPSSDILLPSLHRFAVRGARAQEIVEIRFDELHLRRLDFGLRLGVGFRGVVH